MSSHSYISNSKNENIFININGELFHRSEAKISVFDSGFLLGDGIWEGIRLHKSKLVFIEDHLDRLYASAHGISLDIPYSRKDSLKARELLNHVFSRSGLITVLRAEFNNPRLGVGGFKKKVSFVFWVGVFFAGWLGSVWAPWAHLAQIWGPLGPWGPRNKKTAYI